MKVFQVKYRGLMFLSAIFLSASCGVALESSTESDEKIVNEALQQIELTENTYKGWIEALETLASGLIQSDSNAGGTAAKPEQPPNALPNVPGEKIANLPCNRVTLEYIENCIPANPAPVPCRPDIDYMYVSTGGCVPPKPEPIPCSPYILYKHGLTGGCIPPKPSPVPCISPNDVLAQNCVEPVPTPKPCISPNDKYVENCIKPGPAPIPCGEGKMALDCVVPKPYPVPCISPNDKRVKKCIKPDPAKRCIKVGDEITLGCTYIFKWDSKYSDSFKESILNLLKRYKGNELSSEVLKILESHKSALEKKYQELKAHIEVLTKEIKEYKESGKTN